MNYVKLRNRNSITGRFNMISIPRDLCIKPITSYINELVANGASDFDTLDELDQDKLISLGIAALDDIEIILSSKANRLLASFLKSHDHDDEVELTKAIRTSAFDFFCDYYNQMIGDARSEMFAEKAALAGMHLYVDQENGESAWI